MDTPERLSCEVLGDDPLSAVFGPWLPSTKENLCSADVFAGLLDHGLFADKVPPCFSTVGLAAIASQTMAPLLDGTTEVNLKNELDKLSHDYVRYEALRDINIPRHMGIPHPEAYAVQAWGISKYWEAIATHCNQPKPAISRIFVRHVGNGCIFKMNYKGVERFQLEEDEIQWMSGAKFVVEADIAACFSSIYTHCIPWALHGKDVAKQCRKITELAGNLLDKCTQINRDQQTNGLLIGPHTSNIISEIILTSIDAELQKKGYTKVVRHVDDFRFFATSYEEAELFVKDLGLSLRAYEMSLNEKKTRILELPRPSEENWRLVLNRFVFPGVEELQYSVIRSFLDLALECAQAMGKSTPLNYAIKVIAGGYPQRRLNLRAKRMYAQEAMNLALAYPYLAPLLDKFVFGMCWHDGLGTRIASFSVALIKLGVRKLYPDAIAHALYFALKHDVALDPTIDETLIEAVALDDDVTNVLIWEYAQKHNRKVVKSAIIKRTFNLKSGDSSEKDRHWLLIYQVWSKADLDGNRQGFLASLKGESFQFFRMPANGGQTTADAAVQAP